MAPKVALLTLACLCLSTESISFQESVSVTHLWPPEVSQVLTLSTEDHWKLDSCSKLLC